MLKVTPLYVWTRLLSIEGLEVDNLKILEFYFDHRLTWSSMIEHTSTHCQQTMGALYHVRDYLGPRGFVSGYDNVAIMGASTTQMAEKLSGIHISLTAFLP